MPLLAGSPSSQSPYQSQVVAVCNGLIYLGSPSPFNTFTVAAGQGTAGFLQTNVPVSMAVVNQHVFIVDGISIVDVNLVSGTAGLFQIDTGASAIAILTGSTISAVNVLGSGGAYTAAPTVVFTGGGTSVTATATANLTGASVSSITVNTHGTGYTSAPFVSFTGGGMINATAPQGCTGAAAWRARLILYASQQSPQIIQAARAGDPYDFNYAAEDSAAAFADNPATSGRVAEPVISVIPYTDDYCMVGCAHSMFMYQGDPAAGGTNTIVSQDMGITGIAAWTISPDGELYFVATGGLFKVKPIWEFYRPPENLSRNSYNQFFTNIDPGSQYVTMEWDADLHYLYIFVTPKDGQTQAQHLIYDDRFKGLWPQNTSLDFGPTATTLYLDINKPNGRSILMGGWDGWVRQFDFDNQIPDDDGVPINASITLGPVAPYPDAAALITTIIDLGEENPEITFSQVVDETPSGNVDGSNNIFVLANIADDLQVFFNGVQQNTSTWIIGPEFVGTKTVTVFVVRDADSNPAPPLAGTVITATYNTPSGSSNWNAEATLNAGPDAYSVTEGTPRNIYAVQMPTDRRQKTFRQRLRGRWFSLTLSNSTDLKYFSFESAQLEFMQGGYQRPVR